MCAESSGLGGSGREGVCVSKRVWRTAYKVPDERLSQALLHHPCPIGSRTCPHLTRPVIGQWKWLCNERWVRRREPNLQKFGWLKVTTSKLRDGERLVRRRSTLCKHRAHHWHTGSFTDAVYRLATHLLRLSDNDCAYRKYCLDIIWFTKSESYRSKKS